MLCFSILNAYLNSLLAAAHSFIVHSYSTAEMKEGEMIDTNVYNNKNDSSNTVVHHEIAMKIYELSRGFQRQCTWVGANLLPASSTLRREAPRARSLDLDSCFPR